MAEAHATASGLFLAAIVVSIVALLAYERNGPEMVFLAFSVLLPSLCVVPYFVLVTKNIGIAVLFSLSLVFCMKLAGCVVVVLVHGWDADARLHDDALVASQSACMAVLAKCEPVIAWLLRTRREAVSHVIRRFRN